MKSITFDLYLFGERSPGDIARGRKSLLYMMNALVSINILLLRQYRNRIPALYDSNVIYRPEHGSEYWKDILRIIGDGYGDCEDLACWLCAEYRYAGIQASPYIKWLKLETGTRYHATVRLPDGRVEDPSKALGMHGAPIVRRPVYISPE